MGHYLQHRSGKPLIPKRPGRRATSIEECPVRYCSRPIAANGLCGSHAGVAWRMNIAPEELPAALDQPCAVCGEVSDDPDVDHDHSCCAGNFSCGKCLRGVLCARCNGLVGRIEPDMARVQRAIDYLNRGDRITFSPAPSSHFLLHGEQG